MFGSRPAILTAAAAVCAALSGCSSDAASPFACITAAECVNPACATAPICASDAGGDATDIGLETTDVPTVDVDASEDAAADVRDTTEDAALDVDAGCAEGTVDLDGDAENGCECVLLNEVDVPDDDHTDSNCDGIDGDASVAIFVSPDGADSGQGTSPDEPVALLRAQVIFAGDPSRNQLLLAAGDYSIAAPFELLSGMLVVGDYAEDFLSRDAGYAVVTAATSTALTATGIESPTLMQHCQWRAASAESGASIAATIVDSSDLEFVDAAFRAGDGGTGQAGSPGSNGLTGANGINATGGGEGEPGAGGTGGAGGIASPGTIPSQPGQRGNGGDCGTGGTGGGRGTDGGATGFEGRPGNRGCSGGPGANGAGGSGPGTIEDGTWVPASGADGDTGDRGAGGGGGGGGGYGIDGARRSFGGNGGGGGQGGEGGAGGGGGMGGGASLGVLLVNSHVDFDDVTVTTALGGDGGAGATGGEGGTGGSGGTGGRGALNSSGGDTARGGDGGNGGSGASGGTGGCGGGGAGGPSIGVFATGSVLRDGGTTSYELGTGGAGGDSCGEVGDDGVVVTSQGL